MLHSPPFELILEDEESLDRMTKSVCTCTQAGKDRRKRKLMRLRKQEDPNEGDGVKGRTGIKLFLK